jgi:large subunit ribosomal protein L9
VDVILLQDVDKLGLRGDVVSVARGYARNYLLPRRLAEEASPGRVAELRKREERLARQQAESFEQAQQIAEGLGGAELRFDVKAGPTGSLFGSVTATDVADELWNAHKVRVDRRKVDLHEPIKRIGRFTVPIELFTDVTIELRTLVVPEGGELPPEEELQALEAAEQAAEQAEAEAAEAAHAEAEAALAVELEEPEEAEEAEELAAETPAEGSAVAESTER